MIKAFYWAEPHDCWCTCIIASCEINLKWTAGHLLWMSVLVLLSSLKGPLDFAVVANNWNSFHSVRMRSRSQWVSAGTSTSCWTVPSLISRWQRITPKRSPNHQETREKLEKISSVSLGHAKSCVSHLSDLLLPSCSSGCSREESSGSWALPDISEISTELSNLQGLWVNITRGLGCIFGSGVQHAPHTHPLRCRQSNGRWGWGEAFCEVSKTILLPFKVFLWSLG